LVDALMDRDAKRARKAAASHVRNAAQAAIALLQNDKTGGNSI
jgi:DNA-binding GntR family transcriptional regulator